jgi:hypothetical protein
VLQSDIASLLRIKRVREQRTVAAMHEARAAEHHAAQERQRLDHVAAMHEAERPLQEQAAYRRILTGNMPAHRMQAEAALLSGLVAYSAVLRQQVELAAQREADCAVTSHAALTAQAAAMRESAAVAAMHARLTADARASDERHGEAELEELAGRCRKGTG